MANLTVTIDEATLRRARIRALEEGTSVNAIVREHLERFADADARTTAARRRVVALARESAVGGEAAGRTWTRDDAYAERTRWPRS